VRPNRPLRPALLAAALCVIATWAGACRTTGTARGVAVDPAGERYFADDQCADIGLLCVPDGPGRAPFRWAYVDVQLGELGEPSLRPGTGAADETYRLVIATSSHGRAIIRLDVQPDESGALLLWNPDGYCSNLPVSHVQFHATVLGAAETEGLRAVIDEVGFWTLAATGGPPVLDGTDWYVEGVREGAHRIVLRSTLGGEELARVAEAFVAAAGCNHRPLD